ncbi:MAG TPA: DUF3501 family protein [Acidimicrobiales bacterium]|nr:DUF3501 family protein [Acidimicrobiales bacterium]
MSAPLTLSDIADLRAYERTREETRRRVIEMKRWRRVPVGPIVTFVFENADTVRFQVQEMARAERMVSDEQIQAELDIYNPLVPGPGELSATLFIELTSKEDLRHWLPRLVGVERSVRLVVGDGVVAASVPADHAAQLTRPEVTASVHYVRFQLTPEQVERFAAGPVSLAVEHPRYRHQTPLGEETRAALLGDLRR